MGYLKGKRKKGRVRTRMREGRRDFFHHITKMIRVNTMILFGEGGGLHDMLIFNSDRLMRLQGSRESPKTSGL